MADLNALYQALRKADAAGDTEGARRLAQYIRSVSGEAEKPAPETTALGQVKEAFKGLAPGAIGLLESAATGASALLPEEMEKAAREKIASVAGAAKRPFEAAPGYEQAVGRKLGEAIGSTAPFLAAGPFGLAGRAAAVGLGVGAGAGEARTRAEQEGATGEQRGMATALGTIPGALEAFAPIRILSRIPTASKAAGVEAVKRAMIAGGEEAAQEAASGFAQNLIARGVYKPEQELIEGLGEQAAYGGATGAIVQGLMDLALGRRARGAQPTQPPAAQQPPVTPAAPPAGTQGELFGAAETPTPTRPELDLLGQPVVRAPQEPAAAQEEVQPPPLPGQEDLGLDYARRAEDVTLEIERLKQQPQTPEVKERIAGLREDLQTYSQLEVERLRAEKEAAAREVEEDQRAREKFPALAAAPDLMAAPDEVKARTQGELFGPEEMGGVFTGPQVPATIEPTEPTEPTPVPPYQRTGPYQKKLALRGRAGELTMKDVEDTGIPPSTTRGWFEQNVVGKTTAEVQAIVDQDPTLIEGKGKRAKILRELLAPRPATFKEPVNVPPTPEKPTPEPRPEPRASEPSVGVPSEPAAPVVPEPGAGVAGPTAEPATPDGLGLVPAGQPAVPGAEAQGVEPVAVETAEEEAQRQREAAEMAAALARQQGQAGRDRVAPPRAQVAPTAPTAPQTQPIPEKLYEPIGTSEIGMEEGQKEILRGPQAMLFPMSKREEIAYAERQREETEAAAEPGAPTQLDKDNRQMELPLRAAPAKKAAAKPAPAPAPAPAPVPAAAPAAQVAPTKDVQKFADHFKGRVVFFDGSVALVKLPHTRSGEATYVPVREDGTFSRNVFGLQSIDQLVKATSTKVFSAAELATLERAAATAKAEDAALAAQFPDGPFTGATSNVVSGPSVDPNYANYLRDLMQSMGLGKIRVFLYHSADAREQEMHLHGSYYPVMARSKAEKTEKGATRAIGPTGKDFMLFVREGMSEAETIEIITHELGHMIQQIAFDTAPANVQQAVRDEYDQWLQSLKGKTAKDLVLGLRNRAAAEMLLRESPVDLNKIPIEKISARDRAYWTSFSEWFADNVSRWSTTADKPLSVADKFFSKVAQMMRDLVAVVTGRKFPPAKTVKEFLEKMGPANADAWLAQTPATGQAVQPMGAAPDTPQFRKWFGDSKVVDRNGDPMVVYHGTVEDFGQFMIGNYKRNRAGNPDGFYFAPDAGEAGEYTRNRSGYPMPYTVGANVMPVYLSVKNPFNYSGSEAFGATPINMAMVDAFEKELRKENPNLSDGWIREKVEIFKSRSGRGDPFPNIDFSTAAKTRVLKAGGYDGMRDGRHWVAFDANQIKSAIGNAGTYSTESPEIQNAVTFSTESLIDSMGPLDPAPKTGLKAMIPGFKAGMSPAEPGYAVKFRTQVADTAATIEHRLREQFDGAVRDSLGKLNPMGLYRQAQDYTKTLLEYFQVGGLVKDPATGLWVVQGINGVRPPAEVYKLIDAWGAKNGYDRERATQIASRVLEGVRLAEMRRSNKEDGTSFLLHLKDNEIDQLVAEYNADPDLQAMSKAMDESRIAMVDNMVAVGRLTKETGEAWKDAIGYVPFDRLDDENFTTAFSKIKKVGNKGLAQLGKLPELVGSEQRPVGNVFDNYLNTLGWMVGQTMKTDGTVQTLRSLEDLGYAKFLGRSTQQKENTVGMYAKGEMMYWELPSKYDVLAFKDLNPPKAGWIRNLGKFSNVLRKSVTALPPFALKQVTDDVQRAIMTSGVKNPGALLRMSLSNFGGIALAELRGIQHPSIKQFGKLGLTGEYDFESGKPAVSLLKDLGYKKRGRFETLLHRLDGITRASDLAVRKAIYDQTLKETNDQLLAQTRAREFINFRRRGASDFVGAMVTTIPFFNAYIQGMDVLYRAASGKDSSSSIGRSQARRMFWGRAAVVMTLSSLYAMGAGDDEDYQEMDLRTRDSNWILPGGYKLPVPSELGALFKVVPERVVEYMRRQGTPEEQTAWEATRTALTYMFEQYVGRTVPVPQAVKPLLEAWTNYSFFTGRELEGIYQKQQDPSQRRAANTSELAIAIANFARDTIGVDKVSPILVDNALNGYFGSTAGLLVAMTDSLLNPTRVDRPLHKWALVSNYMYDPVGTRRMTEFYEAREKVGRANATLNELMKTDIDRAVAYAEKNADLLTMEGAINSTLEQLERTRAYRKYLNSPDGAKDMPKEVRELELQELRKMEVDLTGWLREAKTSLGY